MDCPACNTPDIEIGKSEIKGSDFTAKVWYASCHATIGEDVNWGGGYDCDFFVVRESENELLAEVKRLTKRAADVCPVCAGKRHIQTKSRGLVKCASCNGTGQRG